ncbi:CHAT domain-containing protein [Nocardia sp. NPDC127526]|uniref:CHAT domain-containing protein n=1 Tax=Nocardia sp. NPDC127526 TaxID=3345393 RepID=UPI003633F4F8
MSTEWAARLDQLVEQALGSDPPELDLLNAGMAYAEAVDPTAVQDIAHACARMLFLADRLARRYGIETADPPLIAGMNACLSAYASTADPDPMLEYARKLNGFGWSAQAIMLLDYALRIDAPVRPGAPPPRARVHALRGEMLRRRRDLDGADVSLTSALAELTANDLETSRLRAEVLNNLGLLHYDRGDLTVAKQIFIEALTLGDQVDRDPVHTAITLDNLGTLESAMAAAAGPLWIDEEYVNAVTAEHLRDAEYFQGRAAECFEAALPAAAEHYVISLLNRVDVAAQQREHDREDEYSLRAVEIAGEHEISSATVSLALGTRGDVLNRLGRQREVVELLAPRLSDWMRMAPEDRSVPGLRALMSAAYLEHDPDLTARAGQALVATDEVLLARRMAGVPETTARTIFAEYMSHTDAVIGHCLPPEQSGDAPEWVYELLLNRKGVLAERQGQAWLRARTEAGELLEQVWALRAEVARCDLEWTGESTITAARRRQEEAARRLGAAETQLFRALGEEWRPLLRVADVRSGLGAGRTLLDFATEHTPSGQRGYVVFLLGPEGPIRYRRLGDVLEVDVELERVSWELAEPPTPDTDLDWRSVARQRIPAVVAASPELTEEVLIAPTGVWGTLPVWCLTDSAGTVLADDHLLSLVPSARRLADSGGSASDIEPPVVLGAPEFDFEVPEDEPLVFSMRLASLEHARAEAVDVAAQLGVTPIIGAQATRARLLSVRRPRILHIATHGMFLDAIGHRAELSEPKGYTMRSVAGVPVKIDGNELFGDRIDKAHTARTRHRARVRWLEKIGPAGQLSRSALMLSGFNAWLAGVETTPEVSAGIVSAGEFALLDLTGTELVVLSACETGVGAVDYADGSLLGLRTAALAAGAKCCISTLWKVNDAAAATLISAFYRYLSSGSSPAAALRDAQRDLQRTHPAPYHWAGWAVEGIG